MPFDLTPEDLEASMPGRFPHELEAAFAGRAISAYRVQLRRAVQALGLEHNLNTDYNDAITDVLALVGEPDE